MKTVDEALFLALNFDGGSAMDTLMEWVSATTMWIPLYMFIAYLTWKKFGTKGVISFFVCMLLAMCLADMLCGIFKHTGLLKHLWESFPARTRPMFTDGIKELAHIPSTKHGPYGTVSAHASTVAAMAIMSALAIRRKWFSWMISGVVLLICYSRIYLACHYPQDLLLGLFVGILAGLGMYALWVKLYQVLQFHD